MTSNRQPVVYVIDDDESVRRGFGRLLKSFGYDGRIFASARAFLAAGLPAPGSCVVVDVVMPEMDGLALQAALIEAGCEAPVIIITALDDPSIRERAIQGGAKGFLLKPLDADELMDAINWALTSGARTGTS